MDIRGPQYAQLREQVLAALHLDFEDAEEGFTFRVVPTVERKGFRSETSWIHPNPAYKSEPRVKVQIEAEFDADVSLRFREAVIAVEDAELEAHNTAAKAKVDAAKQALDLAQATYNQALADSDPAKWCRDPDCPSTNWGGKGRTHFRDEGCPPVKGAQ